MCEFVSGWFLKTETIYCAPEYTDEHSVLAAAYNIRDTEVAYYSRNAAKFRCTPPEDKKLWKDLSMWEIRCDERGASPEWFYEYKIRDHVARLVEPMFVRKRQGTLLGGCWIFDGPGASVDRVVGGRIVAAINGANLSWANLSGANLRGANLCDANLCDADLSGANLRGANLCDANLCDADLSGANLRGADLSGADLRWADLRDANLVGAKLSGADMRGAHCSPDFLLQLEWNRDEDGRISKKK
jgi:hypothetical protein